MGVPPEPQTKRETWRWRKRKTRKYKFVDDGTFLTNLNVVNGYETSIVEGVEVRKKRDIQTQNIFRRTVSRAENQGMKVNIQKTAMLTISDSNSFTPEAYIEDEKGERITGNSESIKIVGFHFDSRPNVSLHVSETVSKVRRFWMLRHLKKNGLNNAELVNVYTMHLRSCIEFASVVYGPQITASQNNEIEKLQSQSLKVIFGFDESYRKCLELSGLERLEDRRVKAIEKFAVKASQGRYSHWFPRNNCGGRTRSSLKYREYYARCERLRNSPIYYMRRVLNALERS